MDDDTELDLKNICCTCLSTDRKLVKLCKINDGVNNLYFLLSYDPEAYMEGFFKDSTSLHVCWECRALLRRVVCFRLQACAAQRLLSTAKRKLLQPLSHLTKHLKSSFDDTIISPSLDDVADNFIDCNAVEVKTEADDLEDVPLSKLHGFHTAVYKTECCSHQENHTDGSHPTENQDHISDINNFSKKVLRSNKKPKKNTCRENSARKKTNIKKKGKSKEFYKIVIMNDKELHENRESRQTDVTFVNASNKCESCLEIFESQTELEDHNLNKHTEKAEHKLCDICLSYVAGESYTDHRETHFLQYACEYCEHVAHKTEHIMMHFNTEHDLEKLGVTVRRKKGGPKAGASTSVSPKPRRSAALVDQRTPLGFQCTECLKYFENKNQRWKHVQRFHREGFRCHACGKSFAFRHSLARHEQLHSSPLPREQCGECGKMVRVDLVKVHARIHEPRERLSCAACDKTFASRASYTHHLKYTMSHASTDILKYKCSVCKKGYRSRGELRDHENYQHKGHTRHQCPVCGKALATRRCITRHVRRAHHGVKENVRDKICQQCGKAFRDKKGLREHEAIHTGERPLSCEVCGCTFRQSASLYTHKKKVHKIHAPRKQVQVLEEAR